MSNTEPSWVGTENASGTPLSARNCEDFCNHGQDAWLAETDKWYCDDCLSEHFSAELESIFKARYGMDDWSGVMLSARTDDADEFTHFTISWGIPVHCLHLEVKKEITLAQLELERKKNHKKGEIR